MTKSIYVFPDLNRNKKFGVKSEIIIELKKYGRITFSKKKFDIMWEIFAEVCELFDETAFEVYQKNDTRKRPYSLIRQISMLLFRKRLNNKSYTTFICGEFFGLDHATCLHGIKTVNDLIETDKNFRKFTNEIINKTT